MRIYHHQCWPYPQMIIVVMTNIKPQCLISWTLWPLWLLIFVLFIMEVMVLVMRIYHHQCWPYPQMIIVVMTNIMPQCLFSWTLWPLWPMSLTGAHSAMSSSLLENYLKTFITAQFHHYSTKASSRYRHFPNNNLGKPKKLPFKQNSGVGGLDHLQYQFLLASMNMFAWIYLPNHWEHEMMLAWPEKGAPEFCVNFGTLSSFLTSKMHKSSQFQFFSSSSSQSPLRETEPMQMERPFIDQ